MEAINRNKMQSSKFCQLYTYGNSDGMKNIDDVHNSEYDVVNNNCGNRIIACLEFRI